MLIVQNILQCFTPLTTLSDPLPAGKTQAEMVKLVIQLCQMVSVLIYTTFLGLKQSVVDSLFVTKVSNCAFLCPCGDIILVHLFAL